MELVYSVESVRARILIGEPRILTIEAVGLTNTTGWTNARLLPIYYKNPPADGIWEYEFVAEPPQGISLRVLTRVVAHPYEEPLPDPAIKGVRILSSGNSVEESFPARPDPARQYPVEGGDERTREPMLVSGGDKPHPAPTLVAGGDKPHPSEAASLVQPILLRGRLRSNDEDRTGWSLTDVAVDADISEARVRGPEEANSAVGRREYLDGRLVEVRGAFELRRYIVGGYVWTLRVGSIAPTD